MYTPQLKRSATVRQGICKQSQPDVLASLENWNYLASSPQPGPTSELIVATGHPLGKEKRPWLGHTSEGRSNKDTLDLFFGRSPKGRPIRRFTIGRRNLVVNL